MSRQKQNLKYDNLYQYEKDQSLNLDVCLAELIDNSISSFDKHKDEIDSQDLKIKIHFKEFNDKNETARQIIVTDNAYGMNSQELKDAIKLYEGSSKKESNGMNQYGIGLKHSIFWIGDNAEIISKQGKKTHKLSMYPIDKTQRTGEMDFETDVEKCDQDDDIPVSGTKIIIDCYRGKKSNFISKKSDYNLEKTLEFLGKKYQKYLSKDFSFQLIISLVIDDGKDEPEKYLVNPVKFNDGLLTLDEFYKNVPDKPKDEYIQEIKNYFDSKNLTDEISLKLFKSFLSGEELTWDDNVYLDNEQKIGMKIKFSILKNADEKKSGLIICHNKRYIYMPPIKKSNDFYSTYEYCDKKFIEGHNRWIVLELNLEDIDGNHDCKKIKPDQNKTRLAFDDDEYDDTYSSENFKQRIRDYVKGINGFLSFIIDIKSLYSAKKDARDVLENSTKNRHSITSYTTNASDVIKNGSGNKISITPDKHKSNYKIDIDFVYEPDKELIIELESENKDSKEAKIKINLESKFIKDRDNVSFALLCFYLQSLLHNKEWFGSESTVENIIHKISNWKFSNND